MVNFRPTAPAVPTITATQSYSQVIRDTLFSKTVVLPFFANFKARRSMQLPIQEPLLPYLGVYIVGEDMPPDGDPNAGDIRFINDLKIGFQVIIENNDPVDSELKLDAAFWAIMNGLWTDANLTNMWQSDMPDNVRIEGVQKGSRIHNWGVIGREEIPIGELQYIATLRYRSTFDPVITNTLDRIHVETVPIADDYASGVPPADAVTRIISEYEFAPVGWTATGNPPGQDTGTNAVTFAAVPVGSGGTVVAVFNSQTNFATSMTIGGQQATKLAEYVTSLSGLQIWSADDVAGPSADIVVGSSGAMNNESIMVGVLSASNTTPTMVVTNSGTGTARTIDVTVPPGGLAIVGMYCGEQLTTDNWSNATSDYSLLDTSGANTMWMAHTSQEGYQTPTYTGSASASWLCVAAAWSQ